MKRRQFLKATALAGVAGAVASPALAQSNPEVKWRLTSSFPRQLDTIFGTAQIIVKAVADATDGRFQIQPFSAGEIVPGLQALDAVTSGAVECAQTPIYFYAGKDPVLALGTGIPFGLNTRQQHSWWHFGGGAEIINAALAKQKAIGLPCGNSGCQMGGFFRKELVTVDDLKGLKFRIGGLGGRVLQKLGVVPQQIAPADLYPALERGTIDAAEFVGPYDDEKLGLHKVAKYYYAPGWWEGSAMMHLCVGLDKWNALPKHYQAILTQACEWGNNWMVAKYDAVNAPALARLVAGGAELRVFSPEIMDAALKAANELYAEISAQSPEFKAGYESLVNYRGLVLPWWQLNELAFDSFMVRTRGRS